LRLEDHALSLHLNEELTEGLGSDAALLVKSGESDGYVGAGEHCEDLVLGRRAGRHRGGWLLRETERESILGSLENDRQIGFSGRGAMLDGKREALVASPEVEIGVAPRVELGASAESLTSAKMTRGLPGVVDEDDGDMESSLKLPEVTEDGGDVGGEILVDSVEPDEGVEE